MEIRANERRMVRWLFWAVAACCITLIAGNPNAFAQETNRAEAKGERTLRAGAAAANITPALGGSIVGGWAPIEATHIHDDPHARCLVLDNGTTRLAIVVCDNLGMPREIGDAARAMIREATGIAADHVLIACTHTHSAVTARGDNRLVKDDEMNDYQRFIARRIADGVRCAVNNLEPARVAWGAAQEPSQVFNRRHFMKPGTPTPNPFGGEDRVVMNPPRGSDTLLKPAGPTDPEIVFLSVQSADGRPIALLANYSLHYVGGVGNGHVSADYFAIFADRIQQLLGADRLDPPFVGILSNGTSGDINNIDFYHKSEKRWAPYEKMREVAECVAQAVYRAQQDLKYQDWVELGAGWQELTLQARKPTEEHLAYFRAVLAKPEGEKPYHVHEKVYARRVQQLHESPDAITVPLQALRVGDLGISAIPFEVFVEIGLELKEKVPLKEAFTISHANGTYGYLPTVEQHKLGGYETWMGTNLVEIEAAPKIVATLLAMFERLR